VCERERGRERGERKGERGGERGRGKEREGEREIISKGSQYVFPYVMTRGNFILYE